MDQPTDADARDRRDLDLEARLITEAEGEADAGLRIPSSEVKAWIDSLGTANPLPLPGTMGLSSRQQEAHHGWSAGRIPA